MWLLVSCLLSSLIRLLLRWATVSCRPSAPLSREEHVRTPRSPSRWRESLASVPPSRAAVPGSIAPPWASTWRSWARWGTRARAKPPRRRSLAKWWRCPRRERPSWARVPSTNTSVSSWMMLTAKLSFLNETHMKCSLKSVLHCILSSGIGSHCFAMDRTVVYSHVTNVPNE